MDSSSFDYQKLVSGAGGMGGGGGDTLAAESKASTNGNYNNGGGLTGNVGMLLVIGGFLFVAVVSLVLILKTNNGR